MYKLTLSLWIKWCLGHTTTKWVWFSWHCPCRDHQYYQVLPLQESNTIFHKLTVCQNMHLIGFFSQNNSQNSLSHIVIADLGVVVVVVVVALIPAVFPQHCLLLLSCSPSWRWWGERFTPAGGERIFLLSFLKRTHNIKIWFIHIFSKCKMVSCSFSI